MNDLITRPYVPDDFVACLAIFDSNVARFFAPEERADFCQCLECANSKNAPYLVFTRNGSVVACGGLIIDGENQQARLAWGMVDKPLHCQGMGTILTQARLMLARDIPDIAEVGLTTSQHTCGFYERFGFTTTKITKDGFAPGLDRWHMILDLT